MPTIGSVSGTFGHGRSPQNAPQPGFTIYPAIGRTSTWTFTANGAFRFDANAISNTGNCFVITPTTTFIANIAAWGSGGGSANLTTTASSTNTAGAGGAVHGTFMFQGGQPYTVFVGAAGQGVGTSGGRGGASSGVFEGNVFQLDTTFLDDPTADNSPYIALASGGGGASPAVIGGGVIRIAGAGGTELYQQIGIVAAGSQALSNNMTPGQYGQGASSGTRGTAGQTGLPGRFSAWFTGGSAAGGLLGSGGSMRGTFESGGLAYVRADATGQTQLQAVGGQYNVAALHDHSQRSTAGDSDTSGRLVIYLDEYKLANISASGGTVTEVPIPGYELAYRYHTFDATGSFTVNSASVGDTVDIFAVGGGGGGMDSAGLTNAQSGAGGGGGGVALRIGLPITAGTYNVDVGVGGAKSDQYAAATTGRIYSAYRGGDTAFYTNPLVTKGFTDEYWKLLNSFGVAFKYISLSGDDSDGSTQATAYTSFASALSKNSNNPELVVFAVIGGTYTPEISSSSAMQVPIIDNNRPRIFVCAPSKVVINFTPAQGQTARRCHMTALSNLQSAIYGATIVRNMFDTTNPLEYAFFGGYVGNFYNCAFRENSNFWTFAYNAIPVNFRIENCTFFTKNAALTVTTDASKVLVRNSVFNKPVTTDAVLDNTVTNQAVGGKYIITGITDKGVHSGRYSWSGAITAPAKTARSVMIMAQGGGGGGASDEMTLERIGGTGGGNIDGRNMPTTQYDRRIGQDYSSYGFHGGRNGGSGGGGAGYPGKGSVSNPRGGIGVEWPRDSGIYYGTGGDSVDESITMVAPGTVGKGGNGQHFGQSGLSDGHDGMVAIRYVVQGPYTPPAVPRSNVNLIAYGGVITSTATYRQHVFTASDTFVMLNRPEGMVVEALIIGGGGGGGNTYWSYDDAYGGRPGSITYTTMPIEASGSTVAVVVGAGGAGGSSYYSGEQRGKYGGMSSVYSEYLYEYAFGGSGGTGSYYDRVYYTPTPGIVPVDGLFSDNTTAYAAGGGSTDPNIANPANWGGYGSGGRGAVGQAGIQGVVIIRYPIYPAN